jgi:hypothetical protein
MSIEDEHFNVWYNSYDPSFLEIGRASFIPDKWQSYQAIDHDKFLGSIIKPINRYVQALYPRPDLVSIKDDVVILRQRNHAQIFLLDSTEGFVNIDRPHMRQYYQTRLDFPTEENCFDQPFLFYTPWFLDENLEATISQPEEWSPFKIYEKTVFYQKQDSSTKYVEPEFVPFRFKKNGPHMKQESFGKIDKGVAMFDIQIRLNDILIEKIRKFYEEN